MTATLAAAPAGAGTLDTRHRAVAAGAVVLGAAALLARPWLAAAASDPTAALVLVFVALGVAGAACPLAGAVAGCRAGARRALLVAGAGVGAFAAGRLVAGGEAAVAAVPAWLALNALAAVAEEALFRRLLFGLLEPYGAGVAVAGSAAAFAAVHLTVWGPWVLPLDLAAGLVLSWQRWATGRWSVPAVTHVAANVLAVV